MIVVVSGFQRCGSSLMMQMLNAGGLPCFSDPGRAYPAFETMRQLHDPQGEWFQALDGQAVKWLEPQHGLPNPGPDVAVLWMKRHYAEQGRSAVKFLRLVGGFSIPSSAAKEMAASYRRDEPQALAGWAARGRVRVVSFEAVLAEPTRLAREIVDWLALPIDAAAMAREVRPRTPECFRGMLELSLLEDRRARP